MEVVTWPEVRPYPNKPLLNRTLVLKSRHEPAISEAAAHRELQQEALDAFNAGPTAMLRCPGYGKPMTLTAYLNDSFAGPNDGCLPDLIRLLKVAAESSDAAVRTMAQAVITREAKAYADWHAERGEA